MIYRLLVLLGFAASSVYGMGGGSSSSSAEQPLLATNPEDKVTILTEIAADWQTIVQGSDFDLSSKRLDSLVGLSEVYKPSPTSLTPTLFPYETLTKIVLAYNYLKEIRGEDFSAFKNLLTLNLRNNQLEAVDIGSFFKSCPRLNNLDLSYNKITTVTWSEHPVWAFEPYINCIGNSIEDADQVRLKERYMQEGQRQQLLFECGIGCGLGSMIGGILFGSLSTAVSCIATAANPLSWIAVPVGCGSGMTMGMGGVLYNYYDKKKQIDKAHIYFEEKDTQNR